ncbi:MAG: MaoC family dehydratase [Candidatus Thorarchaeota archaeon]|jgi:acyl dehydratase
MIVNDGQIILERSFIGKEYFSKPKLAEAEDMIKYARATNESNPTYYNSPDRLNPSPLYPVVFIPDLLSQIVDDAEEMNLDILRVVHAEQEMWWHGKIHPGDSISSKTKIVDIRKIGINELLELKIECMRDQEVLVEMSYSLIMRGKRKPESKPPSKPKPPAGKGEKIAQRTMQVTDDQGNRYAEASGDHNPIHVNDEVAKSVGLPGRILHGLCTMAIASQTIVDELLEGNSDRLRHLKVRFSQPVFMNDTLTTEVYDGGVQEDGLHVVHFDTKNQSGLSVLTKCIATFEDQ